MGNPMHDFPRLITLHNDALAVAILPELGGRVIEFSDRERGRQWAWRNHRIGYGYAAASDDYDDVWQGGFEELFPNDAPMEVGGLTVPSHGELWSSRWDILAYSQTELSMETVGASTASKVRKVITLDGPVMTVAYSLELGHAPLDHFLFKLHPAFDVNEHCRIVIADAMVEKVQDGFGNLVPGTEPIAWHDSGLDRVRPIESNTNEFVYLHDLADGRVSIVDDRVGASVELRFSRTQFPFTWLFLSYGGWNSHNVAVIEPCTSYPKDVTQAAGLGNAPAFHGGAVHEYSYQLECQEA